MKSIKFLLVLIIASQMIIGGCKSSKESAESATEEIELTSNQGGKYLLKLNPKEGTTGKLIMDINIDITMEMMGQEMKTTQVMEMASNLKVLKNTVEEVVTSMKYEYFSVEMDVPMMGKMEYDTRKEDNEGMMAEAMEGAFKSLLENEITMVQNHSGKTLRMEGVEDVSAVQQGQANMNITSMLNMSQFPEKPVTIGESWKKTITDANSPYAFDATYTLKKVENGKVYIGLESDVSMSDLKSEEAEATAAEMNGKQNGTFIYDQKTMWLIEALINQDFDMSVDQMGMSIPMKMKGDIVLTMEE